MKYVVGFMFNRGDTHVALIKKEKPAWQRGKLNGVGGKIEDGETPVSAMVREFFEETGHETRPDNWLHYCHMSGKANDGNGETFEIDFFCSRGHINMLSSMESEQVVIVPVETITPNWDRSIENVPWLIALALDHMKDGRPQLVTARYP